MCYSATLFCPPVRKGQRLMQLPIVAPAPVVTAHADIFRDLFENRCQFRHFQNYLTGLIVLDNKSLANITRCVLESADKTNLDPRAHSNRNLRFGANA